MNGYEALREYFFTEATKRHKSGSLEALRDEFYDRIRRAFSYLEGEVRRGRGVSSNTFVAPGRNPEATSLERMWMIAREVAIEHHFAVAQLPANLFESGAMLTRNCVTGNQTALEFAQEHDLAVLVNLPLNAFYRNQLIRLADTPVRSPEVHAHVDPFLPPAFRAESLSRKALAVLTNTKGVTCVLSGMRRPNYVDDSLGALRRPAFDVDLHVYEAFAHL
jgi:hypothetical protein